MYLMGDMAMSEKFPQSVKKTKNDGTACGHPPNVPTGSKNQKDAHQNFSETTV